jgi:tetratricopeptide (TPR) repeat protein
MAQNNDFTEQLERHRVNSKTKSMQRKRRWLAAGLCAALWPATAAHAQQPRPRPRTAAPPTTGITIDGSEAMFTTMCALLAAGFEANENASTWPPYRAAMRERLQHQQGPAVDALRKFYKAHELDNASATLSQYLWFGLVSGPAPEFDPVMQRDQLPPDVIALEGFREILSNYYKEQNIGQLWRQVQPVYNREIERLHDPVAQIVYVTTGYLRELLDPESPRTFAIIVEPLVGRITNVRSFGDHYALVLSGARDIPTDMIRHAFLHFMLDGLPLEYPHVIAVKEPVYNLAARAPQLSADLRDDFPSYFAECLVRAVDLRLQKVAASQREAVLQTDDADGYVLARPLFEALAKYEAAAPPMNLFFPDMVRSIDDAAEEKRVAQIQYAAAPPAPSDAEVSEAVARRKAQLPTTVPNDAEVIAELSEGERRIEQKDPQAAEQSFQKVLLKYPNQPRAWYGLGLVAMLERDGTRAKEVFNRLTSGEHAATGDPMVLAWSHVYLGRIYGDEGDMDKAKSEFQAALNVTGGPDQARQAAEKGLNAVGGVKSGERP